ncbi:MAG: phosphate ABC transporter permease subunit PstC, partial [Rubritalea sp.]|uniref:phosphate ABC transporter permease subunit PstC n=1 Tax=Rubritalea sp. TaxID=2109375 RepID=UPI003241BD4E
TKAQSAGATEDDLLQRRAQISKAQSTFIAVDTDKRIQPIYTLLRQHDAAVGTMKEGFRAGLDMIPTEAIDSQKAQDSILLANKLLAEFDTIISENRGALEQWRHDKPLTTFDSLKAFFFGTVWNTGSSRQSLFGIVPLFTGSLLISVVAMFFAIPLAVGAAIYVNQFANKREAGFLKPTIEFIQAVPSVVLGLFGVLVVAGLLKDLSQVAWLQWVPGFPIADRLNVLLAGILLAFMASPTIFTLAEDALNNVPKSHTEASLAMGANKLQTTLKVIVPASLSGIIAAVMLGFGRVIGETMVVLLVAGNMAQMPDFTAGFDVIGQSVHTMTGIIASENGEAAPGSILWEGLFMVGLVLFMISLTINSLCQRILNRNKA